MVNPAIQIDLIREFEISQDLLRLESLLLGEDDVDFYKGISLSGGNMIERCLSSRKTGLPDAAIDRGLVIADSSSDVTNDGCAI